MTDILDTEVKVRKEDPRVAAIHKAIQKLYDAGKRVSCISDIEIRAYVEKHFILDRIAEEEMDRPLELLDD